MIDPVHSLAFSIQANRGVYAVLIGSGVSRAAGIPTGWEITLDLIRKLAALKSENCEPDPAIWYANKFGKEADYGDILDALTKTPSERQQLLRSYFEPSDAEREEGLKQPTTAHRSIAALVAEGYIKVIITTNFDRLMENALYDMSVVPTILSSPDQVHGALPLIHTHCCIFKIHGDYLDTRIRNTPHELSTYPTKFDELLDRIFDEFGLIVCGWSADWDTALRNALFRTPSRRFTTYWTALGKISDPAKRLIEHRAAQIVSIKDADSFFHTIQNYVESLERFSRPHPLSTEAAITSLKRYLSEQKYLIQLKDLVDEIANHIVEETTKDIFSVKGAPSPTNMLATARVRAYEATCSTMLAMGPIGGFWAEKYHYSIWQQSLQRLSTAYQKEGHPLWIELQRYPGTLLLYALGIGAVAAERLQFLSILFTTPIYRENRKDYTAVQMLPPFCLFNYGARDARFLEGMEKRYAPLNDWLFNLLRPYTKQIIPLDERYEYVFDRFEMLMALCYATQDNDEKEYWAPPGAYGYRRQNRDRFLNEIEESISKNGDKSPFVESRIFGESIETCKKNLKSFTDFAINFSRRWR